MQCNGAFTITNNRAIGFVRWRVQLFLMLVRCIRTGAGGARGLVPLLLSLLDEVGFREAGFQLAVAAAAEENKLVLLWQGSVRV